LHSAEDPAHETDPKIAAAESRSNCAKSAKSADRDMGAALRSIYQRTIEENIPDEMLSLLGKLD